ncbi:hypothetical protein [Geminisphaera colitermitum]|uniref:hypothetical protein n=1 Tax=Geminisphaera colitermitum TaxID=1148786 RepID=UPI0005BE2E6B|nr:hypothetical protein [Geminisphaera colitermitum]
MKPLALAATLVLLTTATLAAAEATEARVIADLHKEWGTALPTRSQPLGSWLLLRGAPNATLGELTPLDRFEQKVGGNPDVSIWSYGGSIFNQPGFSRRHDAEKRPIILVSPQKSAAHNDNKGSAYIQWTSPVASALTLVLTLQNIGTDIKGGAGMTLTIRQYPISDTKNATATTVREIPRIQTIKIPNAANSPAPLTHKIPLKTAEGDRILIEMSPVVDGYGNRLTLQAQVLVTD